MIGEMQHRITLINAKRTSNGRGGWSIDYETGDRLEVWAAAELLTIGQQLQYNENEEAADIQFLIRENPFINTDTRILFNGETYEVQQYGPNKQNRRFWDIRAREV